MCSAYLQHTFIKIKMPTVIENRPKDCTACRIVGSVGLVGIGAYLANAGWKNKTLVGKVVISSFSLGNYLNIWNCRCKMNTSCIILKDATWTFRF